MDAQIYMVFNHVRYKNTELDILQYIIYIIMIRVFCMLSFKGGQSIIGLARCWHCDLNWLEKGFGALDT